MFSSLINKAVSMKQKQKTLTCYKYNSVVKPIRGHTIREREYVI